jgi:tagatose-1,6-bisphosphate aldolase
VCGGQAVETKLRSDYCSRVECPRCAAYDISHIVKHDGLIAALTFAQRERLSRRLRRSHQQGIPARLTVASLSAMLKQRCRQ